MRACVCVRAYACVRMRAYAIAAKQGDPLGRGRMHTQSLHAERLSLSVSTAMLYDALGQIFRQRIRRALQWMCDVSVYRGSCPYKGEQSAEFDGRLP